ncbi:hypothetical protein CL614_00515 [archaeon]|nr:hypothetical protein [archaeon]|tara:strand:+ start:2274 stop:2564 length:291 start_codon:yes stop_codon:yes gene_type:complete
MSKEVFLVSNENKGKAEQALKQDDEINRGSISVRQCGSLDIDEEGYFIIVDLNEEALEKAKKLLKDLATIYEKKDDVLKKIESEEEALGGFGNILG